MNYLKIYNISTLCMLLFITNCNDKEEEDCHKNIRIINNLYNAIYFHPSSAYPDTLTLYPNPALDSGYFKIADHSEKNDIYRSCIEGAIKLNPEGKLMYFIYDAYTLETVPWDTVAKNYLILKRYDLSLEDLQGMNWTITYP